MNNYQLEARILVIQVRENFNFFNKISEYVKKLKEYYNVEYTEDQVEDTLNELQDAILVDDHEKEIVEVEEDF